MTRKNRDSHERTRKFIDSAKERLNEAKKSTEDFVSEKPLKSLLLATAVGVVVGVAATIGIGTLIHPRRRNFVEQIRDYF